MVALVRDKHGDIARLCARHKVRRLDVFGSAGAGRFDPEKSDIDFLVEFMPLETGAHADAVIVSITNGLWKGIVMLQVMSEETLVVC